MILNPASLPVQPVIERASTRTDAKIVIFEKSYLQLLNGSVIVSPGNLQDKSPTKDSEPAKQSDGQQSQGQQKEDQNGGSPDQSSTPEKRSFWERVFKIPPVRKRIEKALTVDWKFTDVKPRDIEYLASEEGEEARVFFLNGSNARQYQRILKEYKCGFESREGKITDDNVGTINEYGPELVKNHYILMENKELIKRYFAGVFRDGRIGTQSLIRISNSMWFGPFVSPKFKLYANILNTKFQVPNHVIGPMLASVGDSYWLRQVMSRRTSPQEFQQLLNSITSSSTEDSGNAFAPALQLLVLGEEHKIPFKSLESFVLDLKLKPKDFGPFSAMIFNLGAYRLASEIRCPTFTKFLRQQLDEFGPDINQESARHFLLSFRE